MNNTEFLEIFHNSLSAVIGTIEALIKGEPDVEDIASDVYVTLWNYRTSIFFRGDELLEWLKKRAHDLTVAFMKEHMPQTYAALPEASREYRYSPTVAIVAGIMDIMEKRSGREDLRAL